MSIGSVVGKVAGGAASAARRLPRKAWAVIGFVVLLAGIYVYFRFFRGGGSDSGSSETVIDEERLNGSAAGHVANRARMRGEAESLISEARRLQQLLESNQREALQNQQSYKELFASQASRKDMEEGLYGPDDDDAAVGGGSFQTAFMRNGELDEKKQGMIELSHELGQQQNFLREDMRALTQQLRAIESEWAKAYPSEAMFGTESDVAGDGQPAAASDASQGKIRTGAAEKRRRRRRR